MFTKLLVPLDGSSLAEQALAAAVSIARVCHAELELILVRDHVALDDLHGAVWNAGRTNEARRYLEAIAAEVAAQSGPAVAVSVRQGNPVDAICRRADESGTDLIVMTSHGRTGFNRAWFGSVADGVVTHARIPVLMLRPIAGATRTSAVHVPFEHVLVTLDGSSFSQEMLPVARALASVSHARMTLMRISPTIPDLAAAAAVPFAYVGSIVDEAETRRLAVEVEDQLAAAARQIHAETGLEAASLVIIERPVAESILASARTRGVDVIAMSTHGGGISRFLLGSVADKVMRGSDVAMLMYRPSEVRGAEEPIERLGIRPQPIVHA